MELVLLVDGLRPQENKKIVVAILHLDEVWFLSVHKVIKGTNDALELNPVLVSLGLLVKVYFCLDFSNIYSSDSILAI